MHFGVAQRFAALIAGVRQMSVKLRAEASAGLPRSVRGYAGLWRGIASQGQGDTDLWRGMVSERGGGSCYVPSAARSFAFGELAHIEALVFCVRAYGRVKEICFRGAGAHQGACSFVARDGLGTWGGFVLCTERRAFICFRRAGAHRGACSFVARDGLGTWGGVRAMYRAPCVHLLSGNWCTSRRLCFASARRVFIRFRGAGAHQGACVLRPSSARVDHLGSGKRLHDQVQRL